MPGSFFANVPVRCGSRQCLPLSQYSCCSTSRHIVAATTTTLDADHLRLLVVLYDSAEVASLLGLGLSLRAVAARAAIAFGSAGAVLFFLDAYINVVVVPAGQAFVAAIFYAVVGEFPSIAMCVAGVVLAMRRWHPTHASPSQPAPLSQG